MSETRKKKQTAVRLSDNTKSDVKAIAMAWGVPQQEILERAIIVFLLSENKHVERGREMQEDIARRRREIG